MSDAVSATGILVQRSPAAVRVLTSSVANPSVITTAEPHGLETGDSISITGHSGSTPALAGPYTVTKTGENTFTIPVSVTVAGSGGTTAPVTNWTTIAEVTSVTPPGYSRNKIEVSIHNEASESYILGILRQKDATFRINYLGGNATHAEVIRDMLNNTKANWRFLFPSGLNFWGPGRVQRFELADVPVDAAQQADVTIAWAGPVTHALS